MDDRLLLRLTLRMEFPRAPVEQPPQEPAVAAAPARGTTDGSAPASNVPEQTRAGSRDTSG